VLPFLRPASFGMAFIDSFHSREAVESDISAVVPLLAPGAWLALHDYGQAVVVSGVPFGVTEAVDAFAARMGVRVDVVDHLAVLRLP
jgi:hypothetical protein